MAQQYVRLALMAAGCMGGLACETKSGDLHIIVKVEDEAGSAATANKIELRLDDSPDVVASLSLSGDRFPVTLSLTTKKKNVSYVVHVDAVDSQGLAVGRGYASVRFNANRVDTFTVELARACAQPSECDDGVFCDGFETCDSGMCVTGDVPCPPSAVSCVSVTCIEGAFACDVHADNDSCAPQTVGGVSIPTYCNLANGCVIGDPCTDTDDCDDPTVCDGTEECIDGRCQQGAPPVVPDNSSCTLDLCSEPVGVTHPPDTAANGSNCTIPGEAGTVAVCDQGSCLPAECGDGYITGAAGENCDDGNINSNDGCDSSCRLENGWICSGVPTVCHSICGDQLKVGTEQCDKGVNNDPCDGCNADCTAVPNFGCGDAHVCGTEACDLGAASNNGAYGGCNANCTRAPYCGNGQVNGSAGETCDDGGTVANDGCNGSCHTETGWSCTGAPSTCAPICGDSLVRGTEPCDSGINGNACDGCFDNCTSVANFGCGDGYECGTEACDLGSASNTGAYGGCNANCTKAPFCGDGTTQAAYSEQCDNGAGNSSTTGAPCGPTCHSQYWVGGSVSGIAGHGSVTLRLNGAAPVTLSTDTTFTFPSVLTNGAAYAVTVSAVSTSPAGACFVENGNGTIAGVSVVSVQVQCVRRTTQVSVGMTAVCAILSGGVVKCWGLNYLGALGYGDALQRGDTPASMGANLPAVALGTNRTAVSLTSGDYDTCALLDNATVKCWGNNTTGQLGIGDTGHRSDAVNEMGDALPTVSLGTGRTALAVAVGSPANVTSSQTCALLDNNSVKCWGAAALGQLGLGDVNNRGDNASEMGTSLPAVSLGAGRTSLAVTTGYQFSCALLDNGTVKCWGANASGQLGQGDVLTRGDAASEMGDFLPAISLGTGRTATEIDSGGGHTCAILDNQTVKCWGSASSGQLGGEVWQLGYGDAANEMGDSLHVAALGTGRTPTALALGGGHTCALLDNGAVKCWGLNSSGQLGLGDVNPRGSVPNQMGDHMASVSLGSGRTATMISASASHSCAVLDSGGIKCWGYNGHGDLGIGDTVNRGEKVSEMGDNLPYANVGW